jgi:hypothetical protein
MKGFRGYQIFFSKVYVIAMGFGANNVKPEIQFLKKA